jgi:nuclear pore complex protein Nup155
MLMPSSRGLLSAPAACAIPADALASLEQRLRRLERFLARRRRRDSPPALAFARELEPKRRRVDPSAARRAEERSLAALRGTLRRAAEASALLRVASESGHFARAAARLAREDGEALTRGDMSLRRLATTAEGARLASALVEALMGALVSAGDVERAERTAQKLQTLCPMFFGGDERRFYRARQSLQAARDARDARDAAAAERLVAEALAALLEVPAAGNLSATMAELADAGCFHGLIALPLCAAAAARRRARAGAAEAYEGDDVFEAARGPFPGAFDAFDEADRSTAAAMTAATPEACREYVCVALRALATGAPDEGAPPGSLGAVCAALSPERRARGLAAALARVAQASSPPAAAAARARLAAAKAEAEAAAAAAARAGAPFVPPPEVSCAAQMATATASPAEAEGAALDGGAFAARVYAELVHLKEDDALLSLPPAPLERFLAEKGAFAVAQQGGALTQSQARHLELLAKLYRRKGRDALAARVYFALAERDAAGAAVPLEERAALLDVAMRALTDARRTNEDDVVRTSSSSYENENELPSDTTDTNVVLKVSSLSTSDAAFFETLDGKIKVLAFQTRLRAAFLQRARVAETSEAAAAARAAAADLERELRPLSDMFNDFARPAEMWDLCLEMLHFAGYRDQGDDQTAAARELWDAAPRRSRGGGVRRGEGKRRRRRARAACAAAAALGPKLFPSDAAFPVAHVALRLELLAAGLWHPDCGDSQEGGEAVRSSQKRGGSPPASGRRARGGDGCCARRAILSRRRTPRTTGSSPRRTRCTAKAHHDRRMQAHARHLQTPALRLRLLRSALRVLRRWEASTAEREPEPPRGFGAYGGGNRRARAALADVCAGYAGEARRLLQVPASEQGAAEALAAEFEALGRRLASA